MTHPYFGIQSDSTQPSSCRPHRLWRSGLGWMGTAGLLLAGQAVASSTPRTAATSPTVAVHALEDRGAPEAFTFLVFAKKAAQKYQKKYGHYPAHWHDMHFSYAHGPHHTTDQGLQATRADGAIWRPKQAHYRYQIVQASQHDFLMQAINDQGQVEYEVKPAWAAPAKVALK
jgi:hypothetical protein